MISYVLSFVAMLAAGLWPTRTEVSRWRARRRQPIRPAGWHLATIPGGALRQQSFTIAPSEEVSA